jgi:hypothetical protein
LSNCARQYGKALLETVEFLNERSQPLPPMASGFGHVPLLKRRVEMIVKQRVSHRLAWPGGLLVLLVAVVVLPVAAQDAGVDAKPGAPPINVERRLKQLEDIVKHLDPETRRRTKERSPAKAPAKAPSRVFPPLQSGMWRSRWDHKVDGNVVTDSWWDLQLDFRSDKVTGHVLKISDGNSSDLILSGELIRARANPSGAKYGRFVSVLVLRSDTSENGYFNVSILHRVSESRFVGTSIDSKGGVGDVELTLKSESKK